MDPESNKLREFMAKEIKNFLSKEEPSIDKREKNFFSREITSVINSFTESSEYEKIINEIDLEKERVSNRQAFLANYHEIPPSDDISLCKEGIQISFDEKKQIYFNFFTDYLCLIENPCNFVNYFFKMLIPLNPKASFELKDFYNPPKNVSSMGEGCEFGNISASFAARNYMNRKIVFMFHHSNVFKKDLDSNYSLGCVYQDSFKEDTKNKNFRSEEGSSVVIFDTDGIVDNNVASQNKKPSLWDSRMSAASKIPSTEEEVSIFGKDGRNNDLKAGFSSSSSSASSLAPAPAHALFADFAADMDKDGVDEDDDEDDDDENDNDNDNDLIDERRFYEAKLKDASGSGNSDFLINYCLAKKGKCLQIIPKGNRFCRSAHVINYIVDYQNKHLDNSNDDLKVEVARIVRDLASKDIFLNKNGPQAFETAVLTAMEEMNLSRDFIQDDSDSRVIKFLWSVLTCRKESTLIYLLNVIIHLMMGKFFFEPKIDKYKRNNSKYLKSIPNLPNFTLRKHKDTASLKIKAYCGSNCDYCRRGNHKSHQIRTVRERQNLFTKVKEFPLPETYKGNCFPRSGFHTFFCPRINFIAATDSKVSTFLKELVFLVDYNDRRAYKSKLKKNGKKLLSRVMTNDPTKGDVFVKRARGEIIDKTKKMGLNARDVMYFYIQSCGNLSGFRKKITDDNDNFEKFLLPMSHLFFTNSQDVESVQSVVTKQNSLRIHRILNGIQNIDSMSGVLEGFYVSVSNERTTEIFSSNVNIMVLNAEMTAIDSENDGLESFSVTNLMSNASYIEKLKNINVIAAENKVKKVKDDHDDNDSYSDIDDEENDCVKPGRKRRRIEKDPSGKNKRPRTSDEEIGGVNVSGGDDDDAGDADDADDDGVRENGRGGFVHGGEEEEATTDVENDDESQMETEGDSDLFENQNLSMF
nr:MAG: hypothetical protein [Porcellio scaber clopovirus]